MKNARLFCLSFLVDDGTDDIDDKVRSLLVCRHGVNSLLIFGNSRYKSIWKAAMFLSVLPDYKRIGKNNYNAVKYNDCKYLPVKNHFEYLKTLGEVRAMQVIAMLINGMQGHANRDDNIDVTYLPI